MDIDLTKVSIKGILGKIKESVTQATSEEDFKIDAVQILRKEVSDKFELPYGKFEKGIFVSGLRGRADVLYGHLFIEFEKPGVLIQKGRIPKVSPEAENPLQTSLATDFLSSPICTNLCDFVPHMDTIWTPKFLIHGDR